MADDVRILSSEEIYVTKKIVFCFKCYCIWISLQWGGDREECEK